MLRRLKKTWSYPGYITSIEANRQSILPDQFRIQELKEPWDENILYGNQRDVLDWRKCKGWQDRNTDLNLWSKPPLGWWCYKFGQESLSLLLEKYKYI